MAEDADLFDVVPPSPVATSTQVPHAETGGFVAQPSPIATSTQLPQAEAGGFFPPLPQLPGISDDNGAATSGPVGQRVRPPELSPIVEARQRSRPPELSPIVEARARLAQRRPYAGVRDVLPRRLSGAGLGDWLIRPVQPAQLGQWHIAQADPDVVEIQDDSDSDDDDVAESLDTDSSVEEIVVDSDADSDVEIEAEERPAVLPDLEPVIIPALQVVIQSEGYVVSEVTVADTEQQVITVPAEPATGSDNGGEPAPGTSTVSVPAVPSTPASLPVQQQSVVQALASGSPADFRSPKRRRVVSPEKSAGAGKQAAGGTGNQGAATAEEEEEDGESCPICFEPWTTSGVHRLASLRCGHLFGQSCIEKWLKGQGGKCPHCNAKAKRQDIRVLYAKTIKAMDTTERDRALRDLERERELHRKSEMDGAQLRLQYQQAIEENNKMRLEIERLKAQLRRAGGASVPKAGTSKTSDVTMMSQEQIAGRFSLDKTIKIYDNGNCRVMTYCPSLATLVASQPSASQLFPGFGVKKINMLDVKASQYLTIHTKAIRDVAFMDNMLLSCGLDKKVKMTSLLSNAVVQGYDTPLPAWSCTWHGEDRNYFYAGLQNGKVLKFDVRNTEGPVSELNKDGSKSPVVSLQYVNCDRSSDFRSGGLMVGQLDRVTFFENQTSGEQRPHLLPLEGLLTSLCFEPDTRHILASFRPTARHPAIRHQLCELISRNISAVPTAVDNVCSCQVVHSFQEGRTQTVLSRSTLLPHPGDSNRLLVCGGDENTNCVHIWDSGTGQKHQSLMIGGTVVDLTSFTINNTVYLAALTDKQCKVFKWS